MNQDLKILELLIKKKELGITDLELDLWRERMQPQNKSGMSKEEIKKVFSPETPFDDLTPEEIMYYATPYFDYLQEQKALKKQRIEGEISDGTQSSEVKHDSDRRQGTDSKGTTG